jgi:hypothetical protein
MIEAYTKVWNTIRTSQYIHLKNGSVLRLIDNFYNIYKDKTHYNQLMGDYNDRLNELMFN